MMVLNGPQAMDAFDNQVELIDPAGQVIADYHGNKEDVARGIVDRIQERLVDGR